MLLLDRFLHGRHKCRPYRFLALRGRHTCSPDRLLAWLDDTSVVAKKFRSSLAQRLTLRLVGGVKTSPVLWI